MSFSLKTVGESSVESFSCIEIIWKIPDVFSLTKVVDYGVESSPISFANATWCLQMFPNGESLDDSEGFVNIWIRRLWSAIPEQRVFYDIYFLSRRWKKFEIYSSVHDFNNIESSWGASRYLAQSMLETERDLIAPDGTVTVICQLRTKKNAAVGGFCQKELSKQTDGVDKEVRLPAVACGSKALCDYEELLLSKEDCDVTIKVKGQDFQAHRAILRARSSVFASMFRNDMKEKATGVIDVVDCDPATFPDFLHYLYCGSVEKLSGENVFSLYAAADKYDVQDLKSECLEYMKDNLSIDTFCDTVTLSLQYCETELLKLATDFFAKNLPKIIVTVKWQAFIVENPIQSNELLIKVLASDTK